MRITDVKIKLEPNSEILPKIVARAVITLENTILITGFVIVSGSGGLAVGFPADFLPDAVMHRKVETAILDEYQNIREDR